MTETLDPRDCPHDTAQVEAYLAPTAEGLPWQMLAPEQRDLDGIRAQVSLGVCPRCASRVISVRTWDAENWTPERGTAWTSRWTRLVGDNGEPM